MKTPISERLCSASMLVPHDAIKNDAMLQTTTDRGLKPNGLTIDAMRENSEFYRPMDDLDRAAVASQTSGKLAKDVKKAVNAIKSALADRNKPKNSL